MLVRYAHGGTLNFPAVFIWCAHDGKLNSPVVLIRCAHEMEFSVELFR